MSAPRQLVLDTETTGLEPGDGHRIIEIGCVEIVARRRVARESPLQWYLNPEREIDEAAIAVHGITREKLAGRKRFRDIAEEFIQTVSGAQLVIHNAPFDVAFLDSELKLAGRQERIRDICDVLDTLELARKLHPGQRNGLDALCKRYSIDNSQRSFHGALLDAEILADVYLTMTGGQNALLLDPAAHEPSHHAAPRVVVRAGELPRVSADAADRAAHAARLARLRAAAGGRCVWDELEPPSRD